MIVLLQILMNALKAMRPALTTPGVPTPMHHSFVIVDQDFRFKMGPVRVHAIIIIRLCINNIVRFKLMLLNADVDECLNIECHSNATCENVVGSFMCACNDGFTRDGLQCVGK